MELKEFNRNKYLRAPTTAPYHVLSSRSWEPLSAVNAAAWYEELKSGRAGHGSLGQRGTQAGRRGAADRSGDRLRPILTRALGQSALPPASAGGCCALPRAGRQSRPSSSPPSSTHTCSACSGAQAGGNAPQTTMPLILAGVIADKDPGQGPGDHRRLGFLGQALLPWARMIPGGARLHAVYGDRVLIERNGALETLMLPRTPMKGGPIITPAPRVPTPAALRDNPTVLAGLVRVQPVFNQGKLSGYRIFPGGSRGNSTFTQLGLASRRPDHGGQRHAARRCGARHGGAADPVLLGQRHDHGDRATAIAGDESQSCEPQHRHGATPERPASAAGTCRRAAAAPRPVRRRARRL